MSNEGSLPRTTLPIGLAALAVWVGYVAHQGSALASAGLGLHARIILTEVCLAAPALLALLSFHIPAREGLALLPVSPRALLRTLLASGALWICAIGLSVVQAILWPAPPGHAEMFVEFWDVMTPRHAGGALLSLLAVAFVPAVCEELLFRGTLLPALLTRLRVPAAILVSAALFGAIHTMPTKDGDVTLYQVPQAMVVGLALGVLRLRSGSLLPGILAHTLYNATTFVLAMLTEDFDPSFGAGFVMMIAGGATLAWLLGRFRAAPPPPGPLLDSTP
jgi:membrane protease YdiL (CAAX protease family)